MGKYWEHVCGNCGLWLMSDALKHVWPDIPGLTERTEPGNEIPSGECPDCGALTYVVKKD